MTIDIDPAEFGSAILALRDEFAALGSEAVRLQSEIDERKSAMLDIGDRQSEIARELDRLVYPRVS